MTVYVIADIKVTDNGWIPDYAASVHDLVHKHGGKYLSRSGNVKTLEGKPLDSTFIALLEFPSAEAVQAFATDPKYAPYAAARQAGSESRLQLIDDTDVAGTIPYLPKAFNWGLWSGATSEDRSERTEQIVKFPQAPENRSFYKSKRQWAQPRVATR